LEKEPKSRFQSAAELEAALAACSCSMDWNACVAAAWWQGITETVEIPAPTTATDCTRTLEHS
jgi:eukaryotic-like serine/threonine-protein kinase